MVIWIWRLLARWRYARARRRAFRDLDAQRREARPPWWGDW
jgi:hypothetical protein